MSADVTEQASLGGWDVANPGDLMVRFDQVRQQGDAAAKEASSRYLRLYPEGKDFAAGLEDGIRRGFIMAVARIADLTAPVPT